MKISTQKKALLHVAKHQLGMADDAYRALLTRCGGVTSSSDLDEGAFDAVMAEFERLGFRNSKTRVQNAARPGMATAAQIGRIRGLWKAYSGNDDERRLGHWLEKHFHASDVRFLEGWRAGKAIAVLERMAAWRAEHPDAEEAAGPGGTNPGEGRRHGRKR